MVWAEIGGFLLGVLYQMWRILFVQFSNFAVLWQLLPVYTGWFAIQFITKGKEYEDAANRFMNGFSLLWVAFQLGEYVIENLFSDPLIIFKILIVVGLFAYAIFVMRITLLNKDISIYLGRIGEISSLNIAALLFVQDLIIIHNIVEFFQIILAFVTLYFLIDLIIDKSVKYIHKKVKIPVMEEKEEEEKPKPPLPRYKTIIQPPTQRVAQTQQRTQYQKPYYPRPPTY